ncbi:MAG TPA: PEP-CTERM sorting domain-containing protein [Alphaproteobacteria bacterium]|nr:PEP-CTERM sorting domain-containing protein [Alphaproteobacteria bacterium]USO05790.1 MAG: PEP-CTERM sorting domain-containing protein [Rhodospirillales bacterium]HOO82803.1 PEP-CTERM sorting domain-containing protein [Alphaproteobacteria bacterium]
MNMGLAKSTAASAVVFFAVAAADMVTNKAQAAFIKLNFDVSNFENSFGPVPAGITGTEGTIRIDTGTGTDLSSIPSLALLTGVDVSGSFQAGGETIGISSSPFMVVDDGGISGTTDQLRLLFDAEANSWGITGVQVGLTGDYTVFTGKDLGTILLDASSLNSLNDRFAQLRFDNIGGVLETNNPELSFAEVNANTVPEPAVPALLGAGLAGLGLALRRREDDVVENNDNGPGADMYSLPRIN